MLKTKDPLFSLFMVFRINQETSEAEERFQLYRATIYESKMHSNNQTFWIDEIGFPFLPLRGQASRESRYETPLDLCAYQIHHSDTVNDIF